MNTFYNLTFKKIDGTVFNFADLQNKVVLIVNTASKCGFTPQLKSLEEIYQKYEAKGFEILAFPSNQFAKQEPLNNNDIGSFCKKNYGTSFTVFEKSNVKGENRNQVFNHLYQQSKSSPKWNFQKYLIDKNGNFSTYFYSFTKPNSKKITNKIEQLL